MNKLGPVRIEDWIEDCRIGPPTAGIEGIGDLSPRPKAETGPDWGLESPAKGRDWDWSLRPKAGTGRDLGTQSPAERRDHGLVRTQQDSLGHAHPFLQNGEIALPVATWPRRKARFARRFAWVACFACAAHSIHALCHHHAHMQS